jgi:hypothetical protein
MISLSSHQFDMAVLLILALILFVFPTVEAAFRIRLGWRSVCVFIMGWIQFPEVVFPGMAAAVGACVIRRVVRWANRHSDPRFANRPPDVP